jgi:hypothetical protein
VRRSQYLLVSPTHCMPSRRQVAIARVLLGMATAYSQGLGKVVGCGVSAR